MSSLSVLVWGINTGKGPGRKRLKVLMIERGTERPEHSMKMKWKWFLRLFQDGAIQAARDFRFTVFQELCKGSTVVNNAVCFKMPES
jgi:hypothetical protein